MLLGAIHCRGAGEGDVFNALNMPHPRGYLLARIGYLHVYCRVIDNVTAWG